MPIYAALTPGDPPQMEFVPFGSHHKHPKIIGGYLIFKFANKALFAEAIPIAERERGFGLFLITRKDFGTNYTPHGCKTIEDFTESLDISGWCEPCQSFTYGVNKRGKCWRCKKPTQ